NDERTAETLAYSATIGAGVVGEIWMSLILGLIYIYFGQSFAEYLWATVRGQAYHTNTTWVQGPRAGQEVAFWEMAGYFALSQAAIFTFGLAMVIEAAALFAVRKNSNRQRVVLMLSLAVAAIATALNLFAVFA